MFLLTLLAALIGLSAALPAVNLPAQTSTTGELYPAQACPDPDSRDFCDRIQADQKMPGAVTVFAAPNFTGAVTAVDAFGKCSQAFAAGAVKSLQQQQGAVCRYYQAPGCTLANHVPVLRHDSKAAPWEAADLGEWSGKIESFKCAVA
jgi:hypothetical protein